MGRRRVEPHSANPKLLDLAPTWAPTPGWTVLHCGPSAAPGAVYSTRDEDEGARRVYDRLGRWFADVLAHDPAAADGMAALPHDTFHVTVSDGLSSQHLPRVSPTAASTLRAVLDDITPSVEDLDLITFGHAHLLQQLLDLAAHRVVYRVVGVASRGFAVVVALAPDDESIDTIERIMEARSRLLDAMSAAVGTDLRTTWRPHVTLGYAIDRPSGAAFDPVVRAAAPGLVAQMAEERLVLTGATLFAFDDMVTFRRSSLPSVR